MAWTTPRTWATGEVVTAAMMNEQVRDNELFLRAHHSVRGYRTANQSIPDATDTPIEWTSEEYDTDGYHDVGSNPSRMTIPSGLGLDGYYVVLARVTFNVSSVNQRECRLRKNGATVLDADRRDAGPTANQTPLQVTGISRFSTTDYVELIAWQNTGGSLDVVGQQDKTWMALAYNGV